MIVYIQKNQGVIFLKKILSLFLSVILLFSLSVPVFSASVCNCQEPPIIYVAALGSAKIIKDAGTENERILFRPDTGDVIKRFSPVIAAAGSLILTKDYDAFGDVLIDCVNDVFGDLALDGNGNSKPNVTSPEAVPESSDHGLHTSYYFGYDFRLDPVENAEKLHKFIGEVKKLTNHSTVRFRASSMGGVVALSYMRLFGTSDIETIIFQCCPLLGTAVAGELFCGKVQIDKDALLRYGEGALPALDSDFFGGVLYALLEALNAAGVLNGLVNIADDLVLHLKDRVYNECLIPIFSTLPGIWSFVPDEYYEEAKSFMKLDPTLQSGLIKKLDFYHYEVQSKAKELFESAKRTTNLYILAGYNMQRTPLVTAYMNTSDGTVDTTYASCGAVCAPLGEELRKDYVQARFSDKNYISPDRMIDASTCLLPESTFFVKDMLHCKCHDGHAALYRLMFSSKEQFTVFDYPEYPQFLQNDTVNKTFHPVEYSGSHLNTAFNCFAAMPSFLNFVKLITAFLKTLTAVK